MQTIHRNRVLWVVAALPLSVTGSTSMSAGVRSEAWAEKSLGSFPLSSARLPPGPLDSGLPAVQPTLVWPFDPYYEEMNNRDKGRARIMAKVRAWAKKQGAEQLRSPAGLNAYRGPGGLGGFEDNPQHDPILYQYGRLHPWSDSITTRMARGPST